MNKTYSLSLFYAFFFLVFLACNKKEVLEGNWYVELPNDIPIHYLKFDGNKFKTMDVLGYSEEGKYDYNGAQIALKYEEGTQLIFPLKRVSQDELIIGDSSKVYKDEGDGVFSPSYELFELSTSTSFSYDDIPVNSAPIHLFREDSLKIILGHRLSGVKEIPNYLHRGHNGNGRVILLIGEGVTLEDYKEIILRLISLGVKKAVVLTGKMSTDKTEYWCIYDIYEFWYSDVEDYVESLKEPPIPWINYKYASADAYLKQGGFITEIESIEDYYLWKGSRLRKRDQVLQIDKNLSLRDYFLIKDDLSKFRFWNREEIATIIE